MNLTRRSMMCAAASVAISGSALAKAKPAAADDDSGKISVPGGKVWYRRFGKGKPKTPLLLLHGGPGAGHDYLLPMQALADERPVIFYDQLGCGRSDAPEDASLYTFSRFVIEIGLLRYKLGLDRIILFGQSWGAMLAIEYLITGRPDGVEKLVLAGGLASIPQASAGINRLVDALPNGVGKRIRALEAAGQQNTPEYEKLAGIFYDTHVCRVNPKPPEYAATIANLSKSPAYRIMNGPNEFTIVGTIKDWERRPDLDKIKVPTLVTTGEFDEVTIDCQETLHTGIAGSHLEVMKGCSHLTMLEQPDAYNAIVRKFIA
jgi:proline iminopeptidase